MKVLIKGQFTQRHSQFQATQENKNPDLTVLPPSDPLPGHLTGQIQSEGGGQGRG